MSLVTSRKNPITGAIVVADVVLNPSGGSSATSAPEAQTEQEILQLCRQHLARHKVPAMMRFVPSLNVTGAGKLARGNA